MKQERKQYWLQFRENPRKIWPVYCTDTGRGDPPGKEMMIFESTDGSKAWAVKKDRFNVEWRTYVNPPKDAAVTWPWGDRQCPKCGRWMLHHTEPINDMMAERCRCCGWKTGGIDG